MSSTTTHQNWLRVSVSQRHWRSPFPCILKKTSVHPLLVVPPYRSTLLLSILFEISKQIVWKGDLSRQLSMEKWKLKSPRYIAGDPRYRDYDLLPIVSAFNLILAADASRLGSNAVIVGRNKFFFPRSGFLSLAGGLQAVHGFYSSVRTAHKQLMVNVDGMKFSLNLLTLRVIKFSSI